MAPADPRPWYKKGRVLIGIPILAVLYLLPRAKQSAKMTQKTPAALPLPPKEEEIAIVQTEETKPVKSVIESVVDTAPVDPRRLVVNGRLNLGKRD